MKKEYTILTIVTFLFGFGCSENEIDYNQALQNVLKDTTVIRVRSGGSCHRRIEEEQTLTVVHEPKEVRKLVSNLRVDAERFHCLCCGWPTFEFYAGDELRVTLSIHHARSLRWTNGWKWDAAMTPESAVYVWDWLSRRGVEDPSEGRGDIARDYINSVKMYLHKNSDNGIE